MEPLRSYHLIQDNFKKAEIQIFCFDIKVPYEELDEKTLSRLAQSLYEWVVARGRMLAFLEELKRQRPNLSADIPFCFHEFIAEQCNTEQKINDLIAALNLTEDLPSSYSVGERAWREDKAEKLQSRMLETGQWDRLLQVMAGQTDDHITLERLEAVFSLEAKTPSITPPPPEPTPPAEARPFPFDPFLQLNFISQHAAFRQHVHQPVVAFAILGLPNTYLKLSLRLLLKRLLAWTTTETAVSRMMPAVDFLPDDPDAIWKQIASKVGLGMAGFSFPLSDEDKQKIAQGVFNRLKTQHVIFIFEGINDTLAQLLIRHFWQKLITEVTALREDAGDGPDTKLLAFLVDNRGQLSEDAFNTAPPPAPIVLPPVGPLTPNDLLHWLLTLPAGGGDPRLRDFAHQPQVEEMVLQVSQGVPDKVLEYICAQCGYDYYGEFNSWLQS